jgi:hypothetical protein
VRGNVDEPNSWVKRFDDSGQTAALERGNKAVMVSCKFDELVTQGELLRNFVRAALGIEDEARE